MVDKRRRRQAYPARPYKRIDCYLLFALLEGVYLTRGAAARPGSQAMWNYSRLRQRGI